VPELCPLLVADTVHVPASGSVSVHVPPELVPDTVFEPFVAVTAAPLSTVTTRENDAPPLAALAFVLPTAIITPPFHI
jgi:hypothetical protein